jgi:hypothetical protein
MNLKKKYLKLRLPNNTEPIKQQKGAKMKKIPVLILLGFCSFIYAQEFPVLKGDYLGQTPPGDIPVVFAPEIVSSNDSEHSSPAFSPDGNEIFWWVIKLPSHNDEKYVFKGMTMQRVQDKWTAPDETAYCGVPFFSQDGKRLYFGYSEPLPVGKAEGPYYIEKQGNNWSEVKTLGLIARYPELKFANDPTLTRNGTLYFLGYAEGPKNNYGIYRSELINGEYRKPELLPRSINLPTFLNWTPFIAPDESYLLFSSNRSGSLDDYGDLYISFRIADGNWTEPVNLGDQVNTSWQETTPMLSPDSKYLFFTRETPNHGKDVFWVSANIIDKLREKSNEKK